MILTMMLIFSVMAFTKMLAIELELGQLGTDSTIANNLITSFSTYETVNLIIKVALTIVTV